MTFVNSSSFVKQDSKQIAVSLVKLQPLHIANFSTMYAARPAGESLVAKATEWGRVAENNTG